MQALLKGKIVESNFINNKTYTTIAEPSADEYSQPNSFKVQSEHPLGNNNDIVNLKVTFGGYIKKKDYKDKQTGQAKVFTEQILFLSALPHNGQK
jgi:hypothetical protein